MSRSRDALFAGRPTIMMYYFALVAEDEDWVLCFAEQQPRACKLSFFELVARALQHVWRATH